MSESELATQIIEAIKEIRKDALEAIREIRKDARACEEKMVQVMGGLNQLELNLTNLRKEGQGQAWRMIPPYNPNLSDKL